MLFTWMYLVLCGPAVLLAQKLELVHVVFSHKFYAPVQLNVNNSLNVFPEKFDYRFFLEHTDDMANSAKMDMFNLGVFLRQRYGRFLGDIYFPEVMRMRTSEYILSMISGQLVNAGLWPPAESQKWNDELDWQPVVTEYVQAAHDTVMLGSLCPSFIQEEKKIFEEAALKPPITDYKSLFNLVSKHYKSEINRPSDIALLYSYFETKADYQQTLPRWAKDIFPNGDMMKATLLSYDLLARSTLQKQLNGGTILKAIINETLAQKSNNITKKLKMTLYSGEERNLIGVLQSMNLWKRHILDSAASLLLEVYSNSSTGQYNIKIIFYNAVSNQTFPLTLPGCEELCPIDKFQELLKDVLPGNNETNLCQGITNDDHSVPDSATLFGASNFYLFLIIFINYFWHL